MWQLAAHGVRHKEVELQVRRQRLIRVHYGVYAAAGSAVTDEARWMGGVLAGGEHGCLVLESAASLWAMYARPLLRPIHVNCPTRRKDRDGLRFHQLGLGDRDMTTWRSIPVTTPFRTLGDLRARLPRDEWEALVVSAVAKGAVGREALTLFRVAEPLTRSRLERIALHLITAHGLPRPEVNHEVLGRERDLVWPAHRVVVEIDGPHHLLPPQIHSDNQRDRELTLNGWIPLRYTEYDLLRAPPDLGTLLLREQFP